MFFSGLLIMAEVLVSGFALFAISDFLKEKMINQGVSRYEAEERIKYWFIAGVVFVFLYFILQLVAIIGVIVLAIQAMMWLSAPERSKAVA